MVKRYSIQVIAAVLFFGAIAGYAYSKTHDLFLGPDIVIFSPGNGSTVSQPLVTIHGEAQKIAKLFLNGREIFTNQAGEFREELLLAKGYNVIKLAAEDKFDRVVEKTLELVAQ